ncbi:L,D-transpeptidase [uncultured Enterovirga sp.]|uniref:L,D-transpeptidase n=1 Tax=uncultured Enterovirga sp. TaxID=2026352 RepID=UPI0035CC74F1
MRSARLLLAIFALALGASPASAGILARVDNARQTMSVFVDDRLAFTWPVSTARAGYRTPAGHYRVQRMHRMWHSRTYGMAPMPYSLFFYGGYAIHGTSAVRQLGRPASHGCVRLAPGHARTLFSLVERRGGARIRIVN